MKLPYDNNLEERSEDESLEKNILGVVYSKEAKKFHEFMIEDLYYYNLHKCRERGLNKMYEIYRVVHSELKNLVYLKKYCERCFPNEKN